MKLKSVLLLSCVMSAGILPLANMAQAGFEWTPPVQSTPDLMGELAPHPMAEPVPQEDMALMPAMDGIVSNAMQPDTEFLAPSEPVIAEPEKLVPGAEPLSVIPSARQFPDPAHVLQPPAQREQYTPPSPPPETLVLQEQTPSETLSVMDEPVNGFGKDVPLVTAIRQLLPASYSYKFAPDVDLGRRVSWDGGESLRKTLENILGNGGYTYNMDDDVLYITSMYPQQGQATATGQDIPGFADVIKANLVTDNEDTMVSAHTPFQPIQPMGISPSVSSAQQLKSPEKQTYVPPVSSSTPDRDVIIQPQNDNMMTPLMEEALIHSSANKRDVPVAPSVLSPPLTSSVRATYNPVSLSSYPDVQKERTWNVRRNSDLRTTLENWARQAGVTLQWNAGQSYSVDYMVWVDGTFEEALSVLMKGYENKSGSVPAVRFDLQQGERPVLIVDTIAR